MAKTVREIVRLQSFLEDLGISSPSSMPMHCDSPVTIFIVSYSTFHEHTKKHEIDNHYIPDKVMSEVIYTPHITSSY